MRVGSAVNGDPVGKPHLVVRVSAGLLAPLISSYVPNIGTVDVLARLFSVEEEASMSKAGVLYADRIELLSPRVALIKAYLALDEESGSPVRQERLAHMRQAFGWPYLDPADPQDETNSPRLGAKLIRDEIYLEALARIAASESWRTIAHLEGAGLLETRSVGERFGFHPGSLMGEMIGDFAESELCAPSAIQMLSPFEAIVWRSASSVGLLRGHSSPDNVESGLVSYLLGMLPAFPDADLSSILEARDRARPALTSFRSAMVDYGAELTGLPGTADFRRQADRLFRARLAPELEQISKLTRDRTFLAVLGDQILVRHGAGLVKAAITFAAAGSAGLPPSAQVLASAAVGAADVAASVRGRRQGIDMELRSNRLLWLFETGKIMSRRKRTARLVG